MLAIIVSFFLFESGECHTFFTCLNVCLNRHLFTKSDLNSVFIFLTFFTAFINSDLNIVFNIFFMHLN